MASISKLSRDKRKKNAPYYIRFVDHEGKRRTTRGCSDRGVTQAKAAKIETVVQQIRLGVASPSELDSLMGKKQTEGLEEYLAGFEKSLSRKDNTEKHVKLTMARVRLVVDGCGFAGLDDLDADKAEAYVDAYCEEGDRGPRTYNHYLQAIDAFGNWLAHPKRRLVEHNPFAGIPRRNTATDIRHKRRALTAEEMALVVKTARQSDYRVQCYDGETRARLYLLSYMTGLRKGEIASLTPRSFDLDAAQPTVTVEAAASKHRKKDVLPLHAELVAMVRQWIDGLADDEPLFPKLAQRKAYKMIQRDLQECGIAYETDEGVADFHAAGRHTHITGLLLSGVKLVEAKELARHSDVRMTMKYTHVGLEDQAKAVNLLPALKLPAEEATGECLHYVSTESGAAGQDGAKPGSDRQNSESGDDRRKSLSRRGIGAKKTAGGAEWRQPAKSGGGGNRTRVPRSLHVRFYVCSQSFWFRPAGALTDMATDGLSRYFS